MQNLNSTSFWRNHIGLGHDNDAHGPLASALLSLLADAELATLNVLDPKVKLHLGRQVEQRSEGKQRTEWLDNAICVFAFVELENVTGKDSTTSKCKNILPAAAAVTDAPTTSQRRTG